MREAALILCFLCPMLFVSPLTGLLVGPPFRFFFCFDEGFLRVRRDKSLPHGSLLLCAPFPLFVYFPRVSLTGPSHRTQPLKKPSSKETKRGAAQGIRPSKEPVRGAAALTGSFVFTKKKANKTVYSCACEAKCYAFCIF